MVVSKLLVDVYRVEATLTRHRASTSTRWLFAFGAMLS